MSFRKTGAGSRTSPTARARNEIYVRPFPDVTGGQWQVSVGGGTRPLWAPSGKELFYIRTDAALMRVAVDATGTAWNAGTPAKLFERTYLRRRLDARSDVRHLT